MDHMPAAGRSGGVVSLWDPNIFKVQDSIKHPNFLLSVGVMKGSNKAVNVINVYTPQNVTQKKSLWDVIGGLLGSMSGRWVILGDFNAVRCLEEMMNSKFNKKCASNFNNFIIYNGLREFDMKGMKFTYHNNKGNKHSKIDWVLVCLEVFSEWPVACLRALPRVHSDHRPLVLSCSNKNFGSNPFKFFNSWLDRKDFNEVIKKATDNFHGIEDSDVRLMEKFKRIRDDIKV
ncbi:uncharacterized protein LOC110943457 [Helianthus annuus]|uniref:uncharacterized protein LOC110943457 n=1 Tax=Helianthus annuus TaxID=4232 RepID=UPI000B907110|nr:uncharacterized protein LOC110943457 [Helianthus annuus]